MSECKNKSCYNCSSECIELIHKGVRDNNDINVFRCKKCGLVFLSDNSHITDTFYAEGCMSKDINLQDWINNTKADDNRRFLMLKKDIKNKVLTDFGCGNAGFLNLTKNHCKKVYGLELQKDFSEYFKKCSLEVFNDISQLPEKSDVITMFHVLEHIKNPVTLLKNLQPYLNDNGKIIIEVPNSNDALIRLYNSKRFQDFVYWSCHLFIFNEQTLKQIAKNAGYKITKFRHIQRYSLMNHLYWIFNNKPGGHKIWQKYDLKPLNIIYSLILKALKATDTIFIELTK